MKRADLKTCAKSQLGGNIFGQNWMMSLLILLVYGLILSISNAIIPGIAILLTGTLLTGTAYAFLKQSRTGEIEIGDLFYWFKKDFGGTFLLGLLETVFVFLWSLLFFIPGIVKSYSYAMCYYIKSDNPDFGWNMCLKESIKMMKGHKWELFVLDLSFIGWYLVGSLCLGLGVLWVAPYHEATRAQFYESLKSIPTVE